MMTLKAAREEKDSVCVVGLDSITFCHLGDLGQPLSSSQVSEIGLVDVLFLPVGGFYTIGPEQGRKVMESMQPKIVVPMHYRLAGMSSTFNALSTVEDFLRRDDNVKKLDGPAFTVSKSDLQEKMQIVIPKLL
jgi:L-ascorbate metabolism protein UlaG (beta-lactamase superfamily)